MHSAILAAHPHIGIHANHMDMVRFSSCDDPGFLSIAGELQRWMQELGPIPGSLICFPSIYLITSLQETDESSARWQHQTLIPSGCSLSKNVSKLSYGMVNDIACADIFFSARRQKTQKFVLRTL